MASENKRKRKMCKNAKEDLKENINHDNLTNDTSFNETVGDSDSATFCTTTKPNVVFDFTNQTWMSDVTFLVQGKRIYGSRTILSLFSPVFKAMLSENFGDMSNKQKVIDIPGTEYDSFIDFLKCLLPNTSQEITKENVFHLLPLAHEYTVSTLLTKCETFLLNYIEKQEPCENNLMRILARAKLYDLHKVKDASLKFLAEMDPLAVQVAGDKWHLRDTLQYAQGEIVLKKHAKLQKAQAEFVQTCKAFGMSDVLQSFNGFETAEAAKLELSLKVHGSELLSGVVNIDAMATSEVVCLYGLQFSAEGVIYSPTSIDENQSYFKLYLKCVCDDYMKYSWSCEVRAKCILNLKKVKVENRVEPVSNMKTFTFTENHIFHTGLKMALGHLISENSGFVKNRELDVVVYFLANKPKFETLNNQ